MLRFPLAANCQIKKLSSSSSILLVSSAFEPFTPRRNFSYTSTVRSCNCCRCNNTNTRSNGCRIIPNSTTSASFLTSSSSFSSSQPQLVASRRHQAQAGISMSCFGSMVPYQGYVSSDLLAAPVPGGGQHKRGVVTQSDLPFDREVIRVPAYLLHVGDQTPKKMIPLLVRTCLKRFVDDRRHASYISKRLFTMMVGGNPIFKTEDEVKDLMYDVEGANLLITKGLLSTLDIHRLGCALYFNRFECEYKGQKGVAIFPEISFFNHSCEPNVKLEFFWDADTGDYVCSARTMKPVHSGDQLVIHYFPDDMDLPLSRFQRKLQNRWSFTCLCPTCRTRTVLATLAAGAFMMTFFFVPLAAYSVWQRKEKLVEAGMA